MRSVWATLRGAIFWKYERGTVQYDVMVALILVFVFFSPRWIPYKDKPVVRVPHQTEVVVTPHGQSGFIYQVDAEAVDQSSDAAIRASLLGVIEPIAGEVILQRYEAVHDRGGRITAYRAWVQKL